MPLAIGLPSLLKRLEGKSIVSCHSGRGLQQKAVPAVTSSADSSFDALSPPRSPPLPIARVFPITEAEILPAALGADDNASSSKWMVLPSGAATVTALLSGAGGGLAIGLEPEMTVLDLYTRAGRLSGIPAQCCRLALACRPGEVIGLGNVRQAKRPVPPGAKLFLALSLSRSLALPHSRTLAIRSSPLLPPAFSRLFSRLPSLLPPIACARSLPLSRLLSLSSWLRRDANCCVRLTPAAVVAG